MDNTKNIIAIESAMISRESVFKEMALDRSNHLEVRKHGLRNYKKQKKSNDIIQSGLALIKSFQKLETFEN